VSLRVCFRLPLVGYLSVSRERAKEREVKKKNFQKKAQLVVGGPVSQLSWSIRQISQPVRSASSDSQSRLGHVIVVTPRASSVRSFWLDEVWYQVVVVLCNEVLVSGIVSGRDKFGVPNVSLFRGARYLPGSRVVTRVSPRGANVVVIDKVRWIHDGDDLCGRTQSCAVVVVRLWRTDPLLHGPREQVKRDTARKLDHQKAQANPYDGEG